MIDIIIIGIIGIAVAFAAKSTFKSKGGCHSCSGCPAAGKCSSEKVHQ
ncbi:MAG: FeoB-associated Cys-rich membrane protein [Tissierellia bacterium]|nr:FeoB-associated Cys-rich membrane protein [Tissierellia bacterium]